jgi:hypothetical protein
MLCNEMALVLLLLSLCSLKLTYIVGKTASISITQLILLSYNHAKRRNGPCVEMRLGRWYI